MKKLALTIAIVLGLGMGAFAQGGLFQYGEVSEDDHFSVGVRNGEFGLLNLPGQHGLDLDENAPLGSGIALLLGFGAAYALKKRKEE